MTDQSQLRNSAVNAAALPYVFDAGELVAALWRRRWWVLLPMLLAASLAAAYGIVRPAKYVATAQILIDPRGLQLVEKDLAPPAATNEALSAIVESQMRVMLSDSVLREVVRREGLDRDPEFTEKSLDFISLVRRWLVEMLGAERKPTDPELMALDILSKGVGANRPKAAFVVNLYVATRDPEKSARLANAIADVYSSLEFKNRSKLASRAADSIKRQLGELRTSLRKAEAKVEAYKKKHDIVGARGTLIDEQQLAAINAQLVAQQSQTAKAKARFEQIRALLRNRISPDAIAEAMASQRLRQLQGRLAAALSQQALLESQFFSSHPRLRQAQAKSEGLRRLIAAELRRLAVSARLDLERSQADEQALLKRKKQLTDKVLKSNAAQVELRELQRKAQANRVVYEAFLVRARELSEQKDLDTSVARVLSPAQPPAGKSGPRLSLLLGAGLFVGFGVGALLALLRDAMDPRVFSAGRLMRETGLPILAQMPRLRRFLHSINNTLRRGTEKLAGGQGTEQFGAGEAQVLPDALQDMLEGSIGLKAAGLLNQLASQTAPDGSMSELRTVLLCSATGGEFAPHDQTEGASGVCLALAVKAASEGYNVLVVDGDRQGRRLSRMMGRESAKGLVEVIDGEAELAAVVAEVPELALWLLPAGGALQRNWRAPTLRPRRRSKAAALDDTSRYDWIFIDGGNLRNSAQRLMVAGADDILLVVHRGLSDLKTIAAAAARLRQRWQQVRGHIIVEQETAIDWPHFDGATGSPEGAQRRQPASAKIAPAKKEEIADSGVAPVPTEQRSGSAEDAYQAMAAVRDGARPRRSASLKPKQTRPNQAMQNQKIGTASHASAAGLSAEEVFARIPDLAAGSTAQRMKLGFEARGLLPAGASFGDMMLALRPAARGAGSSFRQAIMAMLHKVRAKAASDQPQIVMLVAGHKGAGTSSAALSLAYAASLDGLRCLLVDACSADGELSATFSSEFVHKRACVLDSKEHLSELITSDSTSSLQLLPIALANLGQLEPAQKTKLGVGLSKLAEDYDLVVIDGGAVLEDEASLDLASKAHQLFIVARFGLTLSETIEATEILLGAAKERIAGVVLTRTAPKEPAAS